jgi:hypothetical protein
VIPGVARCSRIRLFKGVSYLAVAECCRVLRRRWRQRGVKSATFGAPFPTPCSPLFARLSSTVVKNMIGTTGLRSRRPSDALSCPYSMYFRQAKAFSYPE